MILDLNGCLVRTPGLTPTIAEYNALHRTGAMSLQRAIESSEDGLEKFPESPLCISLSDGMLSRDFLTRVPLCRVHFLIGSSFTVSLVLCRWFVALIVS